MPLHLPVPLSDPEARRRLQALASDNECLKRLHQVMAACNQAVSPEILALPWSARHAHLPVGRCVLRLLQLVDDDMGDVLGDRFPNLPALIVYEAELLADKDDGHAAEMYTSWEGPLLCAMMEYSRGVDWRENNGVVYEVTGPLMDLMMQTEIDPDVPIRLVRPPYSMISIKPEPGRSFRTLGLKLLTKFPADEIIVSRLPNDAGSNGESLNLQILSPAIKPNGVPQGGMALFSEVFLPISKDDETPISERLLECLSRDTYGVGEDEQPEDWIEFVAFLLKILLYIGVPSARQVGKMERTETLAEAKRQSSPQRRDKLLSKASRCYDRIVIGPEFIPIENNTGSGAGHREMPTHWRRGFFKRQRHGEGRLLVKHIFISPLLVRADRLTEGVASPVPKDYLVKAR